MEIKYDEKKWNASNTRMLLTLYSERQADFRNPKRKIKDVWGEMVVALQSQGMTDIDATQLDRKFRNLKKTYYCIRNKHLAKGPQYHPNWQFYDEMTELLRDEPVPWTQDLTVDDYSAMHTFLRDDDQYNPVNDMENGTMLSIGTTVSTVVPRPQRRPYRKRKLAMGHADSGHENGSQGPTQPTRRADPVTVFNAAEPEPKKSKKIIVL
ncbi:uncharacterized protein LOC108027748 [Drosophila biarmipes]|uniref:uncharacterized protein LOC108027748 n=1 Tax=Drosophila biarmipes TaxID=125945 RepID=UPI0007E88598|nr:uncharacterized protein LOC108027748 [Drosophila biarmipes]